MNTEEIWKDVTGYEGRYQVSNKSRVKSLRKIALIRDGNYRVQEEMILKETLLRTGYLKCTLHKEGKATNFLIHRLVASAFIPNPKNKSEINHINGIKDDNRLQNLEWCTHAENMYHSRNVLGNKKNYKLTPADIHEIRHMSKSYSQRYIARQFCVSHPSIGRVLRGETWSHIPIKSDYPEELAFTGLG